MSALNINRVCLAGHLTRDPVVRKTQGGTSVADLGLAINETYTGKDGATVQQTCFVDVMVWGRSAEAAGSFLKRGDPALVEGSLAFDQWETQQGEKRSRLRVKAARVHFMNGKRHAGEQGLAQPQAAGGAPEAMVTSEADEGSTPF
jgi:single-strand DNA-binding protein